MTQVLHTILRQETDAARAVFFPLYDQFCAPFVAELPRLGGHYNALLDVQLDPGQSDALINTDPNYQTTLLHGFALLCGKVAAAGTVKILEGSGGETILQTFQTHHNAVVWNETFEPLPGNPPSLENIKTALSEKIGRITGLGIARNNSIAEGMPRFLRQKQPGLSKSQMDDIILRSRQSSLKLLSSADPVENFRVHKLWGRKLPQNSSFIADIIAGSLRINDDFFVLKQQDKQLEIVLDNTRLRFPSRLPYKPQRCPMTRLKAKIADGRAIHTVLAYELLWEIGTKIFMRIAPEIFRETDPDTFEPA